MLTANNLWLLCFFATVNSHINLFSPLKRTFRSQKSRFFSCNEKLGKNPDIYCMFKCDFPHLTSKLPSLTYRKKKPITCPKKDCHMRELPSLPTVVLVRGERSREELGVFQHGKKSTWDKKLWIRNYEVSSAGVCKTSFYLFILWKSGLRLTSLVMCFCIYEHQDLMTYFVLNWHFGVNQS